MTERSKEAVTAHIKEILTEYIDPVVAQHGGKVNFLDFDNGVVQLEMSGACSGCAGSTATLKFGVEAILTEEIPEVVSVEGFDDPFSDIDPFYTDPFMSDIEIIETIDLSQDYNDSNN